MYTASIQLREAVIALAPPHYATPDAPGTWEALKAWYQNWQDRASAHGEHFIIPVYDGGCDSSMYATPGANHAFRAWHDYTHLRLNAGFSVADELRVAREHVRQLRKFTDCTPEDRRAVWYDTAGQIAYYQKHGEYVTNHRAFIARCFEVGIARAIENKF